MKHFLSSYALKRLLLLDMAVVFGMLLFSVPIYMRSVRIIQTSETERVSQRGKAAAAEWNNNLMNLYHTVAILKADTNLNRLALQNDSIPANLYYSISRIKQTMHMNFLAYEDVSEAWLLFERNSAMITNLRSFINREQYFSSFFSCDQIDGSAFFREVCACGDSIVLLPEISGTMVYNHEQDHCLPLVMPVQESSSRLVILLNVNAVLRRFEVNEYGNKASLTVRNREGTALLNYGTETGNQLLTLDIPAIGCKVELGIPFSFYQEKTASERQMALSYSAIVLIAGVIIALVAAQKSSMPLRVLVQQLHLDSSKDHNEYRSIAVTFEHFNEMQKNVVLSTMGQLLFASPGIASNEKTVTETLPVLKKRHRVILIHVECEEQETLQLVPEALERWQPLYALAQNRFAFFIGTDEIDRVTDILRSLTES